MGIDPLYLFVFAGLFSPGPNVILLTASGARFGFLATLPHVLGVALGVGVIAAVTGLGIGALLQEQPQIKVALQIVAAVWILWMAVKLWKAPQVDDSAEHDQPFRFFQAVLFQWINPKIWAVAIAASSAYSAGLGPWGEAMRLAAAFSGINLFVCLFWSFAGSLLVMLLRSTTAWRLFMRAMAVALGISAILIFV